jgi:membrane-associated phospholipid phosphatase
MTTATVRHAAQHTRLATVVSEVLGPLPVGIAVCVGVGANARGLAGAAWGLLAIVFAAVVPYLLTWRMRHPHGGGLPSNRVRVGYLLIAIACAAAGLVLVASLGAPRRVVVIAITIVVGLLVGAAVNSRWRASNHVAGLAGAVTALSVLYTPLWLLAIPLVLALAWARVRLGRHTAQEAALGGVIGAVVGAVVPALLA